TAYFLPEELTIAGEVTPEVRRRGIYETVVYSSALKLGGEVRPDFVAAGIEADRIDWEKARVFLGVSDLRGIRSVGALNAGGEAFAFESAETAAGAPYPLVAKVTNVRPGAKLTFSVALSVQGTGRLDLAPIGKATTAKLESAWADPSFVGASLPLTRHVSAGGFAAEWQSSHLSRGFPQSWTNRLVDDGEAISRIAASAFGVNFLQPVDGYCLVERAQKYGLLFFVLVFAVFFLFETTAALRIHPLQYAIVGVALSLFFLGFLALSEFLRTELAYGIAAAVCTAMVALYAHTFLRTGRRTLVIGAGLGATYGYLFFVLKSQDYALLAGTAALFGALALLMFFTRRINWYAVDAERAATSA
ncbi:MAG TPA: cell envelope integrity protein CreD, partial [Opitutus sp.]|nr:cell envelope integrity protein CreD [Opitutus sp.]